MLLLITALGAFTRVYKLPELPPGLYTDEAWYALDALDILDGARPIYLPANNGREPLFSYVLAISIAVFGRTPFAVRLPAAIFGSLALIAVYALGNALFNRRVGLIAAALMAGSFWALAFSRIGLRATLLPFFSALMLACAAHAWRTRRLKWMAAAGALLGLCFYTYLSARLFPFALLAFGAFWYATRRSSFPALKWLAAFFGPALLVVAPLAVYALREPQIYLGRVEQVSIWNSGDALGTLLRNLASGVGMFAWGGDLNARHNLPGRPVFDPVLGLAFFAGVGLCIGWAIKHRSLASTLLVVWTGTLLLPTLLSDKAPHFLRAIGALPPVMVMTAVALNWAWSRDWRWRQWPLSRAVVLLTLMGGAALTLQDYFLVYAADARVPFAFQSAARDVADRANVYLDQPGRALYLDKRLWDFAAVRFLLSPNSKAQIVEPGQALSPALTAEAQLIVWPHADQRRTLAALPPRSLIRAEFGTLYRNDDVETAQPLFATYTARPIPASSSAPLAAFAEPAIVLRSASVVTAAGGWRVELVWSADGPVPSDVHTFVHVRDVNEAIVVQSDGVLGGSLYPAVRWRPGDWVAETHTLEAPANVGRPDLRLVVGLYDFATRDRLARTDQSGDSVVLSLPNR